MAIKLQNPPGVRPPSERPPEGGGPPAPGRSGRFRTNLSRSELVAAVLCLLLFLGIVVFPAVTMVIASLRPSGVLPLSPGGWTLSNLHLVVSQLVEGKVLLDTSIYSFCSLAVALLFAMPFAYLTERTDLPGRRLFYFLMFIPLSMPAFAFALAWVLLLNPQAGMINDLIRHVFGSSVTSFGPLNIYSLPGLIWVLGVGLTPSVWLILVSVLRNFNRAHEDAARLSGAGVLATFRRVTLPLMRPGVGAVIVLFLLTGFYGLDVALAIAPGARIPLLPIKIYFDLLPNNGMALPDYSAAAAFGVFGLVFGLILIGIYFRLIRRAEAYTTVSGKDYQPSITQLGRWRWPAYGAFGLYGLVGIVLPLGILVYSAFLEFYTSPGIGTLHWTSSNFSFLGSFSSFWKFFINTVIVALGAALLCSLLSNLVAWLYVRRRSYFSTTLNVLSFIPLAIPGTITSLAFFVASIGTPFFQSLIIMVVAFVSGYLPFCARLAHAAQTQIDRQFEEAALVSGASAKTAFFRINFPLVRGAFTNGALWVFVHAAKEFSVGLILAGAGTSLVANIIYNNYELGYFPLACAMMVVLIAFNMIIMLALRKRITSIYSQATT